MQLIRDITSPLKKKTVFCIGVFDGLHLGHQALLARAKMLAEEWGAEAGVLTFEPYPQAYFAKRSHKSLIPRLMRFRDKYHYLQNQAMAYLVALRFNQMMAGLSGEDFVKTILVDQLNVAAVVVGDDFRFGCRRDCGVADLVLFAKQFDFHLCVVPAVLNPWGERCSSSALRQYLQTHDFINLEAMLGRPYGLSGCVRPGDGRGSKIGVPTANVQVPAGALPLDGVYVVEVIRCNKERLQGVANIGKQPTFSGEKKRIEVHLFDFNENVYGEYWYVIVHKQIRAVKKFDDMSQLIAQIHQDIESGKNYFK